MKTKGVISMKKDHRSKAYWLIGGALALLVAAALGFYLLAPAGVAPAGRAEASSGPRSFAPPYDLPAFVRTVSPQAVSPEDAPQTAAPALEPGEDEPALILTEVRLTPPNSEGVWAELVALEDLDLSDFVLTDMDGNDRPIAYTTTRLKRGEIVLVHWDGDDDAQDEVDGVGDKNANGVRDFYLSRRGPKNEPLDEAPSRTEDQLAILDSRDGHKPIDAVAWSRDGKTPRRYEGEDFASLVDAGQWSGAPLVGREEGVHFNRRWLQDAGAVADWTPGPLATPGRPNVTAMPPAGVLTIVEAAPHEAKDRDWVEIEVGAGVSTPVDLAEWSITDLDGEPNRLATYSLAFQPGDRVLVHWNVEGRTESSRDENGNGARDVYLAGSGLGAEADQCVLLFGHAPYDAVVWGEATGDAEEGDVEFLAQTGLWTGAGVDPGRSGEVLARVSPGGRSAAGWSPTVFATPGYANIDFAQAPRPGALVIAEAHVEQSGNFWVELLARKPLDAAPFVLTDLDGDELPLARERLSLQPDDRLIVRWGKGQTEAVRDLDGDGLREVYLDAEPPTVPADQLVLRLGSEIHDAVVWNAGARWTPDEQKDVREITQAGFRARIENLGDAGSKPGGITLSRTEGTATWARTADQTPGMPNDAYAARTVGRLALKAVNVPRSGSGDHVWAEIVAVEGTSDVSRCKLTDLDGADAPLAEKPVTLRQGEVARVHWTGGTDETDDLGDADHNGVRDLYLVDQPPASTNDQIVLVHDGRFLDAVVWTDGRTDMPFQELEDVQLAIAQGAWRGEYPDRRHPLGSVPRPEEGPMRRASVGRLGKEAWE